MKFLDREHFSPDFASAQRQGTVTGAIATLLGTLLGGGVLSLPFALRRGGIVLGTSLLVLTAIATDFSVFTLVSCSRRSGASTYEAVADTAFGKRAKILCMGLVICVTFLPLVGYTILLRDLLAPVVEVMLNRSLDGAARNLMVSALVVLIGPACTLRTLNALRLLTFFSTIAVALLTVFIGIRAVDCVGSHGIPTDAVNIWPEDGWVGALQAIPIYVCAFACHFNVLPVHGELAKPTRDRLHRMVHWTIGLVALFYGLVMMLGYAYGTCTGDVSDNILNDFRTDDTLMNVGRVGLGVTLLVSFPLLVVPLIGTLVRAHYEMSGVDNRSKGPRLQLTEASSTWPPPRDSRQGALEAASELESPLLTQITPSPYVPGSEPTPFREVREGMLNESMGQAGAGSDDEEPDQISFRTRAWMTVAILSSELLLAFNISMVTDVWGFLGSTANVMIAFTLPCAAYLKIRLDLPRRREGKVGFLVKKWVAGFIVVTSIVAAVACTATNFYLVSNRRQQGS